MTDKEIYEKLPRILVPTINEWRDEGTNHTLINIFKCYDPDKVAQIYTRASLPDTTVCNKFFRINESLVLKSVFKRGTKTGERVYNTADTGKFSKELEVEKNRYKNTRKKHSWFMTVMREFVWLLGKWKSADLEKFIDEFDPQMIFATIYPFVFANRIQEYVIKKCKVPVVCFLCDDNYTYKVCEPNFFNYFHRFWLRKSVKRLMKYCEQLYVIVDKQKEEYDKIFGVDSLILTKGIEANDAVFSDKPLNKPLNIVYTGNLLIGRDKTMAKVAQAVNEINGGGEEKVVLNIYSPDIVADETMKILNSGASKHHGLIPLSEVAEVQSAADILIFTESLENRFKYVARLSFSTKITDYLASGKCIFAIGDDDIAPIHYLRKYDAAVIALTYDEIKPKLEELVNHTELIKEYGKKAFECGKNNHNSEKVDHLFLTSLYDIYERDKNER